VLLRELMYPFGLFGMYRIKKTANPHVSGLIDGVNRIRKLLLDTQLGDSLSAIIVTSN